MILTKQNVGLTILIVVLLSQIKNKERLIKRIIGLIIPIIIFLIYLLMNKAVYDFIDQCILGIFEFGNKNKKMSIISIIFIIELLLIIYFIKKNPKKIENYYILSFAIIGFPLIDIYHTQIFNLAFILAIFLNVKITDKINRLINLSTLILIISTQIIMFNSLEKPILYPNNLKHYEYRYMKKSSIDFANEITKYLKKNKSKKIVFLTYDAYFIKTYNDLRINKLDLINYGNSGLNGTKKNIEMIKKNKDAIFIIDENDLKIKGQIDLELLKYIVNNGEKIDELGIYSIYQIN